MGQLQCCATDSPTPDPVSARNGECIPGEDEPNEEVDAGKDMQRLEELRRRQEEAQAAKAAQELQEASERASAEQKKIEEAEAARKAAEDTSAVAAKASEEAAEKARAEQQQREERLKSEAEFADMLEKSREVSRKDVGQMASRSGGNRYGENSSLPRFDKDRHIPILALVNPLSGAKAGRDILQVAHRDGYYKDRFFNILAVIKGQKRGGLMDIFRQELNKAKDEAKLKNTRCRMISAGGDGTASFAMFVVFKALQADPNRVADGLADVGNGFIWTDEEFEACFPALAQMPLGSANDCGNILGWGQIYPGDGPCLSQSGRAARLSRWIEALIDPKSKLASFDIWGIMPPPGQDATNFKICELTGKAGISPRVKVDGKYQLQMTTTGNPVPFFICLYCSVGFFGYVVARFQLNRHSTPLRNTMEYIRQGASVILLEKPPPQFKSQLEGITIDCGGEPYFPPRRDKGNKASKYRECGFYNINWQAHRFHGADRAPLCQRLCTKREPVKFQDGLLDLQRQKLLTLAKNPGFRMQVDKRKDFHLKFDGGDGKGFFFQYDGEARFAFAPGGAPFDMFIRQVLTIPVVIGPWHSEKLTGKLDNNAKFLFGCAGDSDDLKEQVKARLKKNLNGQLEGEMCATSEELKDAKLVHDIAAPAA